MESTESIWPSWNEWSCCFSNWNTENEGVRGFLPLERHEKVARQGFSAGIRQSTKHREWLLFMSDADNIYSYATKHYEAGPYSRSMLAAEICWSCVTSPFTAIGNIFSCVGHTIASCTGLRDDHQQCNPFWGKYCLYYHSAACGDLTRVGVGCCQTTAKVSYLCCACFMPSITDGSKPFTGCPDCLDEIIFYEDLKDQVERRRPIFSDRIKADVDKRKHQREAARANDDTPPLLKKKSTAHRIMLTRTSASSVKEGAVDTGSSSGSSNVGEDEAANRCGEVRKTGKQETLV